MQPLAKYIDNISLFYSNKLDNRLYHMKSITKFWNSYYNINSITVIDIIDGNSGVIN